MFFDLYKKHGWFDLRFTEDATKHRFDCVVCSRPMWFPKSKAALYKTCSDPCGKKRRLELKLARLRQCATCARDFFPRWTQIEAGNGKVCSQKCNTSAFSAMNTPAARAKQLAAMREVRKTRGINPKGEAHPNWTGGRQATYERRRDAGAYRAASDRRVERGARKVPVGYIDKLGAAQRWKCAICTLDLKTNKFEVDHIVPLLLGGAHTPQNFQLLCVSCNRKKSWKDPITHMQSLGFLL